MQQVATGDKHRVLEVKEDDLAAVRERVVRTPQKRPAAVP
jgi:hypothetical protein